jgi:hypothetical protein
VFITISINGGIKSCTNLINSLLPAGLKETVFKSGLANEALEFDERDAI